MSLESWKGEFYPVPAYLCEEGLETEHCLRKWKGFRQENLERHGLSLGQINIDAGMFCVRTCALCQRYFEQNCRGCPLKGVLDGRKCFEEKDEGKDDDPYHLGMEGDPEPMIRALEEVIVRRVENAAGM